MKNENNHEDMPVLEKKLGRRRFVRGVGVAVPLVLTVSARSALACHCSTVSAAGSRAMVPNSHNATGDFEQMGVGCAGFDPSKWKNSVTDSTSGASVTFESKFTNSGLAPTVTMKQVLKPSRNTQGVSYFMKVIAAAYLNSMNNKVSKDYYTEGKLVNMWKGRTSGYNPLTDTVGNSGGAATWYQQQIQDYLLRSMGAQY